MPACKEDHSPRRHTRHHRMPTFGRHKNSIVGSPLQGMFTTFAHVHGVRRNRTMDSTQSPAGMHPVTGSAIAQLQRLYDDLKGRDQELSREKFEAFIKDVQRDDRKPSWEFSTNCTSFTFEQFVSSWWNEYSVAKRSIQPDDKDLDMPISSYFISSSHNTYIGDGNQFSGEADEEQYKKVLESGCRCVEIDVWDAAKEEAFEDDRSIPLAPRAVSSTKSTRQNHWSFSSILPWMKERWNASQTTNAEKTLKSKQSEVSFTAKSLKRARAISDTTAKMLKGEPRVFHALHTPGGDVALHAAIPFRTVCQTIKKYAFANGNDFPLIISLEVNASIKQQETMAKIMEHEFGDLLLKEELPGCDPLTRQPTLRELKGKILIKTKTGPRKGTASRTEPPAISQTVSDSGSTLHGSEPSECSFPLSATSKHISSGGGSSRSEVHVDKIADAVKKLAIYTHGPGRFASFRTAKDADHPAHIYSISEPLLKELHRTEHYALFEHNKKYLARSFPEGVASFDSSNPNPPTLFWRQGVQMVALNWQRWDKAMELNSAMFDMEDGWVLKPEGYRRNDMAPCQAQVLGKRMDLTITVLAGQYVPNVSKSDDRSTQGTARLNIAGVNDHDFRPRVTCFLHVESAEERDPKKAIHKDEICRRTRKARTDHPTWGSSGSKMHFPNVAHVVEELSFVRICVEDCRRPLVKRAAWACIRLDRLQEGYRRIKLKTDDGLRSDGELLVKIEKKLSVEQPSLGRNTWQVCKGEVERLKSKWSCMG
ncbi:unnamed protein product [Discula destructiva]